MSDRRARRDDYFELPLDEVPAEPLVLPELLEPAAAPLGEREVELDPGLMEPELELEPDAALPLRFCC